MEQIRKYGQFEYRYLVDKSESDSLSLTYPAAVFSKDNRKLEVSAFRSNDSEYTVRFMPDEEGIWTYSVKGCDGRLVNVGTLECIPASDDNHGPVRVSQNRAGFVYADGKVFLPFGTTCYAWTNQTQELQDQTVATLGKSCCNKIRMLIFPKSMPYNNNEPEVFPFEKKQEDLEAEPYVSIWDVSRPVETFWSNLEHRIGQLAELGIEADVILFHPYDKWGFEDLTVEEACEYIKYAAARLGSYHNVWWSLANEHEMLFNYRRADWDTFGRTVKDNDPYGHLISVHNILINYPKKDWMTHMSIQGGDFNRICAFRHEYDMPVIFDEFGYEGNIEYNWGNLTGFEEVHRFWTVMLRGGYASHGETFHREDEVLWWSKGGRLYGDSEPRIAFLKELMTELNGITPLPAVEYGMAKDPNAAIDAGMDARQVEREKRFAEVLDLLDMHGAIGFSGCADMVMQCDSYILQYFGENRPCVTHRTLPEGEWKAEIIDIWEMTRTISGEHLSGDVEIRLPAKQGIAVLYIRK